MTKIYTNKVDTAGQPIKDNYAGNPCTLYQMIRYEPEWVESRFTAMEATLVEKDREIERLKADIRAICDFIPEGWPMPLGWRELAWKAKEAI